MTSGRPAKAVSANALEQLLQAARAAAEAAYAPYSQFRVGAAALVDGEVFTGSNIENASYGLTICAERTAIFKAVTGGHRKLEAVAVACVDAAPDAPHASRMPCGACRQVMAEFGDPDVPVVIDGVGQISLARLLPAPFELKGSGCRS
jgi:cytidine deaminase